jgi:flagellar hook-basal body complex protein FliE
MNTIGLGGLPNVYVPGAGAPDSGTGLGDLSFSDVLKNAVSTVDALHDNAAAQVTNVLRGGGGDMNDVMIAVEKADVSFQLMMQVRNKIVSAYQDIEKMQF